MFVSHVLDPYTLTVDDFHAQKLVELDAALRILHAKPGNDEPQANYGAKSYLALIAVLTWNGEACICLAPSTWLLALL